MNSLELINYFSKKNFSLKGRFKNCPFCNEDGCEYTCQYQYLSNEEISLLIDFILLNNNDDNPDILILEIEEELEDPIFKINN